MYIAQLSLPLHLLLTINIDNMKNVFLGIEHPAIAADNVEQLTQWYCDVLDS